MDRAHDTLSGIEKCPSGIEGLDELTSGGLPKGRPTLVCGAAGCGKTLLAMEFLVHGARKFGEPGVFVSFEETPEELKKNIASLGIDLEALAAQNKLALKHIRVERKEIEIAGEYDLEGLFIQLGAAIDALGARRIALDTVEALFAGFPDDAILRAELRRLFGFLKQKGLTAIVTGERGEKTLSRHGLEEYVADCVIALDHRVAEQIATRRMRIVKYRGSVHGSDEYPFLIDEQGITVLPVTSLSLKHGASFERISSGIARLDAMLGGEGYYRGSSVLVSGTAGTGKTTVAASFADATCRSGERCLYVAFEESEAPIARNMLSAGIDLRPWVDQGLLRITPTRATTCGLELHLASIHKTVAQFQPSVVIVDPISNLAAVGTRSEVKTMLTRLADFLKSRGITAAFTSLTRDSDALEETESQISSLADTWLLLRDVESSGERNRLMYVLKARGIAHSNQVREFLITGQGIELRDVYLGAGEVLTGTARQVQEAADQAAALVRAQDLRARKRDLERKREALEAKIAALRAEAAAANSEAETLIAQEETRETALSGDRVVRAELRRADAAKGAST